MTPHPQLNLPLCTAAQPHGTPAAAHPPKPPPMNHTAQPHGTAAAAHPPTQVSVMLAYQHHSARPAAQPIGVLMHEHLKPAAHSLWWVSWSLAASGQAWWAPQTSRGQICGLRGLQWDAGDALCRIPSPPTCSQRMTPPAHSSHVMHSHVGHILTQLCSLGTWPDQDRIHTMNSQLHSTNALYVVKCNICKASSQHKCVACNEMKHLRTLFPT